MLSGKKSLTVFLVFMALAVFTLATHAGARSPYTWILHVFGTSQASRIEGQVFNPDSLQIYFLADIFSKPVSPRFYASYVYAPLHAFFLAVILGITKSFALSGFIVNLLAMALLSWVFISTCSLYGISFPAALLAGVNILLLPFFSHYLGQPMQYIFGTAVNFTVVLLFMRLGAGRDRKGPAAAGASGGGEAGNPWLCGLLFSVLTFNYDWYVFGGAIILFLLFFRKFAKGRHYLYFIAAGIAPYLLWEIYLRMLFGPEAKSDFSTALLPVLKGWWNYFSDPGKDPVFPFLAAHTGLNAAFRHLTAYVYWPLLAAVVFLLLFPGLEIRKRLGRARGTAPGSARAALSPPAAVFPGRGNEKILVILPAVIYLAEQMLCAAFDWELNPRRAIPLLFSFSWALTLVISRDYHLRKIRLLFAGLAAVSFLLTFSDTLFKTPSIQLLQTGEASREGVKLPLDYHEKKLNRKTYPDLYNDGLSLRACDTDDWEFKRNSFPGKIKLLLLFLFPQALLGGLLAGLLFSSGKAGLLPRRTGAVFLALYALSLPLRFLPVDSAAARLNRGLVFKERREYGIIHAEQDSGAQAYNKTGYDFAARKEYDKALAAFSKVIGLFPRSAIAWYNRGSCYLDMKDYGRAEADYTRALKLNPLLENAYLNRGGIYRVLNNPAGAAADYSSALKINPDNADAWFNLGNVHFQVNALEQAAEEFSRALAINPGDAEAFDNRGMARLGLKDYAGAVSDFSRALKINPTGGDALLNRAMACLEAGDYPCAAEDAGKLKALGIRLPPELAALLKQKKPAK